MISRKGLTTNVTNSGDEPSLVADSGRFRQILYNLLTNAIKFSPDGGTITIDGRQLSNSFELRVSDDGPGITAEERERVFERFEAGSQSGGRQGTGLGLSIVRGFVEMHKGTVKIEESKSGGACFVCTFPYPELDQEEPTGKVA